MSGIRLLVGLGNPGREYAATRHNAGVWMLERIADRLGIELRAAGRFQGRAGKGRLDGRELWLLAPQTFMNLSGDAVAPFARYYKIPPPAILVIHDDLDLPPGVVRLKRGGGAGGHNGLADVIRKLGSRDFARLRIGIGHPGAADQVSGYVLRPAPAEEQALIEAAMQRALAQLPYIVAGDFQPAMNALHAPSTA